MKDIKLLKPEIGLSYPLMEALSKRRTNRKWKNDSLDLQSISNILWAACGETRAATKRAKNRRTMPSGCNAQIVHLHVALETGVYKYNEPDHSLRFINDKDVRSNLSTQKMMSNAPFGIIFVGDFSKTSGILKTNYGEKMFSAGTEAGFMSQNIYLYATSANLNTVVIGLVPREILRKELDLNLEDVIVYTQIVGYPIQ